MIFLGSESELFLSNDVIFVVGAILQYKYVKRGAFACALVTSLK
jgi:hypothetical protein